jgi:hypothetical protein
MQKPPKPIEKRRGKRADLAAWIEQNQPARIDEAEFRQLIGALAPISESYLRKLLRDMSLELAPLVEGVRQGTFDQLEASLSALLDEYESCDLERRSAARRLVISAKDHARWAARRAGKEVEKNEMVLWMLTWLENPPVFREWVKLRRARVETPAP